MASERQEHNLHSPWWGEHVHRYYEALQHIEPGSKVLDIACGNGFGSEILSDKGRNCVIGADIDEEAIRESKKNIHNKKVTFEIIDGANIPYQNETFNFITSFETIEHTKNYEKMLKEFYRILKPKGVCILSTPNTIINSPNGFEDNPYHTQEFNFSELKKILENIFDKVCIYGQQYTRYEKKSSMNFIAKPIEHFFYLRGVRKTPLSIKNLITRCLIGKNHYPSFEDYRMVDKLSAVLKCKTFFATCEKE